MLYPAYVHRNKDATCHVTIPDFKSCFPNIKGRSYLTRSFRRIIESYIREKELVDVKPSRPRDWFSDSRFREGYWIMIDLCPGFDDQASEGVGEIIVAKINS